jgi:hypothetical protein
MEFSGSLSRAPNHFAGNIQPYCASGRSCHFRSSKRYKARAARDIEDTITGTNCGERKHARLCRLELILPGELIMVCRAIPAVALDATLELCVH